jgi:hypothetical protein
MKVVVTAAACDPRSTAGRQTGGSPGRGGGSPGGGGGLPGQASDPPGDTGDSFSQIGAQLFALVARAGEAGHDPELALRAAARAYRDRVLAWEQAR